jgi:peptide/nickel transport system permease protein
MGEDFVIRDIIVKLFMTAVGIILISALPSLFFDFDARQITFNLINYFDTLKIILSSIFHLDEITYQAEQKTLPFIPNVFDWYFYSLILLFASFLLAVIISVLLTFTLYMFSRRIQKFVKGLILILESLPDVFVIFTAMLFIVWVYKQTNILLLDPIATFGNHVYLFPILTLTILPTILFMKMIIVFIDEELELTYVDLAKAKGLTAGAILFKHIFRNAMISIFHHSQYIFWLMLSNLMVLEYILNIFGFTQFLYNHSNPEILAVTLLMIFVPFYLFFVVGKLMIRKVTAQEVGA